MTKPLEKELESIAALAFMACFHHQGGHDPAGFLMALTQYFKTHPHVVDRIDAQIQEVARLVGAEVTKVQTQ